jgi:predicted DCC family thiol-disulfide oxidoreductase YuxK
MSDKSLIVYDGECVFCQNYVRFFRLREAIGPVELLDARSGDPRVEELWRQGYDLDEGMVFAHQGRVFYGAEAVHVLSSLSSRSGLFNRLNAAAFASQRLANFVYPFLKLGRRLTLKARRRSLLREQRR